MRANSDSQNDVHFFATYAHTLGGTPGICSAKTMSGNVRGARDEIGVFPGRMDWRERDGGPAGIGFRELLGARALFASPGCQPCCRRHMQPPTPITAVLTQPMPAPQSSVRWVQHAFKTGQCVCVCR